MLASCFQLRIYFLVRLRTRKSIALSRMAMCLRSGCQIVEQDTAVNQGRSGKENSSPQNESISGKKGSQKFLFIPKTSTVNNSNDIHDISEVHNTNIDGINCEIECTADSDTSKLITPRISTVMFNCKKRRSVKNCLHSDGCTKVPSSASVTVSSYCQQEFDEDKMHTKKLEPTIISNSGGLELDKLLPRNRRRKNERNNLESLTEFKVEHDPNSSHTNAEVLVNSNPTFEDHSSKTTKGMLSKPTSGSIFVTKSHSGHCGFITDKFSCIPLAETKTVCNSDMAIGDTMISYEDERAHNLKLKQKSASILSEQEDLDIIAIDPLTKKSSSQRKRSTCDLSLDENMNDDAPTSKRRRKLDKHERLRKENEVVKSIDGKYEKEYEVECIIESHDFFVKGTGFVKKYLVKWADWDYCHCTWQTKADFDNSPNKFADYLIRESAYNAIETILQKAGGDAMNYKRKSYGDMMMCSTSNVWKMKLWEIEMNMKCEEAGLAPIFVEDWYRLSGVIKIPDFKYLTSPVQSKGVLDLLQQDEIKQYRYSHPDFPEASFRCQCSSNNCGSVTENCCPRRNAELITATYINDKLIFLDDHGIYTNTTGNKSKKEKYEHIGGCVIECSSACSCDISCPLRLIQRGRQVPLVIFYELGKGWGVRTAKDVKKGEFVAEYVGEVMLTSEAENGERMYQFNMCDEVPNSEENLVIDAKHMGNEARFFNHSCDPNMHAVNVYVDDYGPFYSRIALFALRDIDKGEELNFDYFVRIEGPRKGTKCLCGAKKCKKRLG